MSNLLLIALSWLFFGGLHSFLVHLPVRQKLQKGFEIDDQTYRLFFTLFSLLSFFFCAMLTLLLEGSWVFTPDAVTYSGGALLMAGSLYIMRLAFKNYSLMVFIGLQPETNAKLRLTGLNRYVRHPLYLSILLFLIGFAVFWPSNNFIATSLILMGFTIWGVRLEERKLINQFGKSYTDYMKEVPAFIPKFKD